MSQGVDHKQDKSYVAHFDKTHGIVLWRFVNCAFGLYVAAMLEILFYLINGG